MGGGFEKQRLGLMSNKDESFSTVELGFWILIQIISLTSEIFESVVS